MLSKRDIRKMIPSQFEEYGLKMDRAIEFKLNFREQNLFIKIKQKTESIHSVKTKSEK